MRQYKQCIELSDSAVVSLSFSWMHSFFLLAPFILISFVIAPRVIWIYNCKSYTPLIHTHTHKRIIPPVTLLAPTHLFLSPVVMPRVDCRFTTGNCWLRAINYSTHFGAARFYCCPLLMSLGIGSLVIYRVPLTGLYIYYTHITWPVFFFLF